MLTVLGGLADVERDLIRTRTAEGRTRAKARGKHMGRPPSLTPAQQKDAIRRREQGATCRNWPTATSVAFPPCAVPRAPPDLNSKVHPNAEATHILATALRQ
jgi:DNA invertase Pin-like site-specific DNA recombinase